MKKAVAVGGGGGGKGGTAPTDLLVCFPARQHLALMPKPICSPSRSTMDKAAAARRRQLQLPGSTAVMARGSSPMFRGSKAKQRAEEEEDEPQSPKVTCAGQIKVGGRPKKTKPGSAAAAAATKRGKDKDKDSARSWLTVVEEIERLHGKRKKVGWLDTLGIRRDALPFLGGALRSLRHKALCFGSSLHAAAVDSTTDSDEVNGEEHAGESAAASVFSKWLMVLEGGQEPLEQGFNGDDEDNDQEEDHDEAQLQGKEADESTNAPPANALLLMRCRSAPAKGLSMSRRGGGGFLAGDVEEEKGAGDAAPGDGETEDGEELVFMSSAPGFLKLSLDIAKETWVVGGGDPIARCRSWKR